MSSTIIPPPELVQQWWGKAVNKPDADTLFAMCAAQWGADQELEACCEWLIGWDTCEGERLASLLREGRRPKPPSLKEQALADLDEIGSHYIGPGTADRIKTIRRALEQLPE